MLRSHNLSILLSFQVYRIYSNDQEFETTRLNDPLTAYTDETKIVIKLGRALQAGETRIKLYLLRPNEDEVKCLFIFNFDFIEDSLIQKNRNFVADICSTIREEGKI